MNNMQKTPLQEAVERAHALGRRAVIPFITAGFPDKVLTGPTCPALTNPARILLK